MLTQLLSGGDRRSIAQATQVLALVRASPRRVAELASLAKDSDRLVAMRALDVLEKLAHEHADWVQPYKKLFIGPLADSDRWEFRLQIVRALPLLTWTPRERARVIQILRLNVEHPRLFVRAWALDSLATFAERDRNLVPIVARGLEDFELSSSHALQARARQIRRRLSGRLGEKIGGTIPVRPACGRTPPGTPQSEP
jgi:hypothetical protein